MKKNIFILSIIVLIISASCNNSSNDNAGKGDNKPRTKADSLMDDVMAGHDASMAKMNKLSVLKAKMQHTLDSINGLPQKAKNLSVVLKTGLDSSLSALNGVEGRMNKWMDEFNMDSAVNNMDERIKYLESEKIKITDVRNDMVTGINKADSLLKKIVKQ